VVVDLPFAKGQEDVDIELYEIGLEVVANIKATNDVGKKVVLLPSRNKPDRNIVTGKPTTLYGDINKTITGYPVPDKDYDYQLTAAVRPSFDAEGIDGAALGENEEAIRFGALAILKSQINTSWYSPDEVQYFKQMFNDQVNQKKIDIYTDTSAMVVDMDIPSFL